MTNLRGFWLRSLPELPPAHCATPADTARAAVAGRDVPVILEPRLREMDLGAWENRPWGEINREDIETKNAFLFDPARFHVPGSESHAALQQRYWDVMTEIAVAGRLTEL